MKSVAAWKRDNQGASEALHQLLTYGVLPPTSNLIPSDSVGAFEVAILEQIGRSCLDAKAAFLAGLSEPEPLIDQVLESLSLSPDRPDGLTHLSNQLVALLAHKLRSYFTIYRNANHRTVVSYSSLESLHLGGNWAAEFVRNLDFPIDLFFVSEDVDCADVWFFRGVPPVNFGGVAVLVDAEKGPVEAGWAWFHSYPRAVYYGPKSTGNFLPFVSTSFAQRKTSTPLDLLRKATDGGKDRKFLVYLARNCVEHRERAFKILCALHPEGCEALGRCGRLTEIEHPRYSDDYLDDSVEIFRGYKFVLAFENAASDGYITEKIASAFLAGAVPIYWGDEHVEQIFNNDSFIWAKDGDPGEACIMEHGCLEISARECLENCLDLHPDSWVARVHHLASNDTAYQEMLSRQKVRDSYLFGWHFNSTDRRLRADIISDIQARIVDFKNEPDVSDVALVAFTSTHGLF